MLIHPANPNDYAPLSPDALAAIPTFPMTAPVVLVSETWAKTSYAVTVQATRLAAVGKVRVQVIDGAGRVENIYFALDGRSLRFAWDRLATPAAVSSPQETPSPRENDVMTSALASGINNQATKRAVLAAAWQKFGGEIMDRSQMEISADYEHGHWWVTVDRLWLDDDPSTTYDVVDAEGPGASNGFDFESVGR